MYRFCLTTVLSDNITVKVSTNTTEMIDRMKKAKEKHPDRIRIIIKKQPEEVWTAFLPFELAVPLLADDSYQEKNENAASGDSPQTLE